MRQRVEAEETAGVLSSRQLAIVAEASERLLPRTDTAGAKEAGVPAFIDRMLGDWFPAAERQTFLAGVDDLEARSRQQHGRSFLELGDEERDGLLAVLEEEALAARGGQPWTLRPDVVELAELSGLLFFDLLRWLVFVGYYTSEAGMTQELGYRVVPGPYVGCDDEEA